MSCQRKLQRMKSLNKVENKIREKIQPNLVFRDGNLQMEESEETNQFILSLQNLKETQYEPISQNKQDPLTLSVQEEETCCDLLDTQSYKEICIKEQQKNIQLSEQWDISNTKKIEGPSLQKNKTEVCLEHGKHLQIVCTDHHAIVCSHCAIFGEHRSHNLVPLRKITEQISLKQKDLNHIFVKFKEFELKRKEKKFRQGYLTTIQKNSELCKRTAKTFFDDVKNLLEIMQVEIYHDIDLYHQKIVKQFEKVMRRKNQFKPVYEKWEDDSKNTFKALEKCSIGEKIKIILSNFCLVLPNNASESNVVVDMNSEGRKYLDQMIEEFDMNLSIIQQSIKSFKIKSDAEMGEKLSSFVFLERSDQLSSCIQFKYLKTQEHRSKLTENENHQSIIDSFTKYEKVRDEKKSVKSPVKFQTNSLAPLKSFKSIKRMDDISNKKQSSVSIQRCFMKSLKRSQNHESKVEQRTKLEQEKSLQKCPQSPTNKKLILKHKRRQTFEEFQKLGSDIKVKRVKSQASLPRARENNKQTAEIGELLCQNHWASVSSFEKYDIKREKGLKQTLPLKERPSASIYRVASSRILRSKSKIQNSKNKAFLSHNESKENQNPIEILNKFHKCESELLDLSNCRLDDTQMFYFLTQASKSASKSHKIKSANLSNNKLTIQGLEKLLPFFKECSLLNLSRNLFNEKVIDLLIRKRCKIEQMEMVNVANNAMNTISPKLRAKLENLRKEGILVSV